MILERIRQFALLVALCTVVYHSPGEAENIKIKIYPHNETHPKVLPNNFKLPPKLVKDLNLQVPMDFESTILQSRYNFSKREMLAKALLHGDYKAKTRGLQLRDSYEPLDQVGNMVLDYMITRVLIMNSANLNGKDLSILRTVLLSQDTMAFIGVKNRIDQYLFIDDKHSSSNPDSILGKYKDQIKDLDHFQNMVSKFPEKKDRPSAGSFMHRIMKAVVGAVYVDSGYDIQKTDIVIMPMFEMEVQIVYNRFLNKQNIH